MGFLDLDQRTKMSMIAATSPAVAAAPTTWPAGSRRAVSASVAAATTKASTPLPASAQLSAMPGASVLNPAAWVAFRVRFQATNPAAPISIGVNITIGWLDLGWLGWVWVGLAPGVQRVADERAFVEQPLVVGLHRKAALADRQQPRAQRVAVQIVGDVGGVHDPGQPAQGRVAAELEGVDQDLEGALVPTVGELRTGGVERAGLFDFGDGEDLVGGDVADLGLGVDEPADQPGAGDPVGLGTLAGDPLHGLPSSSRSWGWGWCVARPGRSR